MNKRDPKHVFIGLPLSDGKTRWETSMSLLRLTTMKSPAGHLFSLFPGGGCDVAHGRNLLLHQCINHTDAGKMVFIDSDIEFTPRDLFRLCSWLDMGLGIVCGIYPRKSLTLSWSINGGAKASSVFPELWESPELCTGFLGLDIEQVMLPMIAEHPETEYVIEDAQYRGEIGHEIFAMGVVNRRRLSEDYYFSKRATDMGYKLFVDPTIQLGHIGDVDYLKAHQGKEGVLPLQT